MPDILDWRNTPLLEDKGGFGELFNWERESVFCGKGLLQIFSSCL